MQYYCQISSTCWLLPRFAIKCEGAGFVLGSVGKTGIKTMYWDVHGLVLVVNIHRKTLLQAVSEQVWLTESVGSWWRVPEVSAVLSDGTYRSLQIQTMGRKRRPLSFRFFLPVVFSPPLMTEISALIAGCTGEERYNLICMLNGIWRYSINNLFLRRIACADLFSSFPILWPWKWVEVTHFWTWPSPSGDTCVI